MIYLIGLAWISQTILRSQKQFLFLGGFKVGKSRLIRFLNPTVNFPDMDHQARNTEGADFYFVDSTLYIDTEGLFQHHGDFREPLVRTFVLNYLRYQASMVVYVLEKTLEDDHEMISDLWNVFRTSNTIERFVVIHNYRNITEHENFHYVVDKNERYLVPECYEHRNDIGYSHSYGDDDTVRYVTHYLIGNHDSLRNHNETVFRKVNDSIGQLLRRDRIDRNEFLRRLCYAFQETLNFFALFDSQFAHVRPIEIQNRIKFQLVLREGAPLEMRFKLDKDYKVPLVNISQHTRRGVASLKVFLFFLFSFLFLAPFFLFSFFPFFLFSFFPFFFFPFFLFSFLPFFLYLFLIIFLKKNIFSFFAQLQHTHSSS